MSDHFEAAFESYAPEALQLAYDFCDAHPDVRRVWVVAVLGKAISASVAYDVDGRILGPQELDQQIPGLDCSREAQVDELFLPLVELTDQLHTALEDAGVEAPTRVVVRYDVAREDMEASMTYDDLQPGVPEEDRIPDGHLFEQWFERLKNTGSDSAEA